MDIKVETENCDYDRHYLIEESADSKIVLTLELDKIVTMQSRNELKDWITQNIRAELSKFKWIISGDILVDFTWYLNAVEKQETDKIGDIDNISKPIQDSLIGQHGILIDDSQIAGLYSSWLSKNELLVDNILKIEIRFNNDYVLQRDKLKFIQYHNAICLPLNIDLSNLNDLFIAKILVHSKLKQRRTANQIRKNGFNADRYLVKSSWDYHRTRLNDFKKSDVIKLDDFNELCLNAGLTYYQLLKRYKEIISNNADA